MDYYPWEHEPPNGVTEKAGTHILYDLFRNPLAHALGLDTETAGRGRNATVYLRRRKKHLVLKIIKHEQGLSEDLIESLERSSTRPDYAPATIITTTEIYLNLFPEDVIRELQAKW